MDAFEDFRQLLILYYDANLINDEDFVLLYDMFPSRNRSFPYYEYACFDLNNMSEAECKAEFRFEKKRPFDSGRSLADPTILQTTPGKHSKCNGRPLHTPKTARLSL